MLPTPTDAELEILQALWAKQPETVRYVNEQVNKRRGPDQQVGYTTTLKQMQVMLDKGLLKREIMDKNHLYSPALQQEVTQSQVILDLAAKAFEGSASSLVMRAIGSGQATPEELKQIKALIEAMEQKRF